MYSIDDFGGMIADSGRFGSYAEAIAKTVRNGDVVIDLGCGPGIFALLACRAGARRVYAIESEAVIDAGREFAAANGFSDRIEFLQCDSRRVNIPERANVIVSDLRGVLPLFGTAIQSLNDARQRFLAPDGVLIPQRDVLRAALVESESYYSSLTSPWQHTLGEIDLSSSLPLILNNIYKTRLRNEELLSKPQTWCVLDYMNGATCRPGGLLHFEAERGGTAHGLCVWFDAQLTGETGFSCAPGSVGSVYGQFFLPLLEPLGVVKGQDIEVDLHADFVGGDYIWRWETKILADAHNPARHFQQSTFQGARFSGQSLQRRAADYVPTLSEVGQADRWLLQAMDGKSSFKEIAQCASERFPNLFPQADDAFRRAAELFDKLSR
jgi:protein arginine N-methyltransferase 1